MSLPVSASGGRFQPDFAHGGYDGVGSFELNQMAAIFQDDLPAASRQPDQGALQFIDPKVPQSRLDVRVHCPCEILSWGRKLNFRREPPLE